MIHHDHGYGPSGGHEAEPELLAECGEQGRAGNVGAWILQPLQREIEFASQAGVVEDEPVGMRLRISTTRPMFPRVLRTTILPPVGSTFMAYSPGPSCRPRVDAPITSSE